MGSKRRWQWAGFERDGIQKVEVGEKRGNGGCTGAVGAGVVGNWGERQMLSRGMMVELYLLEYRTEGL